MIGKTEYHVRKGTEFQYQCIYLVYEYVRPFNSLKELFMKRSKNFTLLFKLSGSMRIRRCSRWFEVEWINYVVNKLSSTDSCTTFERLYKWGIVILPNCSNRSKRSGNSTCNLVVESWTSTYTRISRNAAGCQLGGLDVENWCARRRILGLVLECEVVGLNCWRALY